MHGELDEGGTGPLGRDWKSKVLGILSDHGPSSKSLIANPSCRLAKKYKTMQTMKSALLRLILLPMKAMMYIMLIILTIIRFKRNGLDVVFAKIKFVEVFAKIKFWCWQAN